jgi:hypothetical protein
VLGQALPGFARCAAGIYEEAEEKKAEREEWELPLRHDARAGKERATARWICVGSAIARTGCFTEEAALSGCLRAAHSGNDVRRDMRSPNYEASVRGGKEHSGRFVRIEPSHPFRSVVLGRAPETKRRQVTPTPCFLTLFAIALSLPAPAFWRWRFRVYKRPTCVA